MDKELKQKEKELIERAAKQTMIILKSGKCYMIVDYYTERILAGPDYSLSLGDVERFLKEQEA